VALSKRTRFEVFKRDSFTCQYCGKKAPDVVLHVDHIDPKALGGDDGIINLITACEGCNLGKAAVPLSDSSAVSKQRDQLARLQERQDQIEMMMQWQRSLVDLDAQTVDSLVAFWCELSNWFGVKESGRRILAKLARKYGYQELTEAMRIAGETYFRFAEGDAASPIDESSEIAFNKISGICRVREQAKAKPWLADLYYIRGILRNRNQSLDLDWFDQQRATSILSQAFGLAPDTERLKQLARRARSWSAWENAMSAYIESMGGEVSV
jgi:HNH endonuclease